MIRAVLGRLCDGMSHIDMERDVLRRLDDFDYAEKEVTNPGDCPWCGYSLEKCNSAKSRGAVACCPDCDHSSRGGAS